ncbi:MAG: CopG family transcriptional regulator [Candidatus Rokuibacteriota bacterium]
MARRRSERTDDVTLKIPRPLYERLRQVIEGTGFHSVTEFCVYVLRDLASSQGPAAAPNEDGLTSEEVAAIRRRLQSLGYLED